MSQAHWSPASCLVRIPWIYCIYLALRQDLHSLKWLQITKSVEWNFATIWVLSFLNNPKDLDLSCKIDLDFLALIWKEILSLITEEMQKKFKYHVFNLKKMKPSFHSVRLNCYPKDHVIHLTLKVPVMTAADDIYEYCFIAFQRK